MGQVEKYAEAQFTKQKRAVFLAVFGGLASGVQRAGGELTGFSVKFNEHDTFMTLRADFPAGGMVAFVGSDDLAGCLVKAHREAKSDALRWKDDKWR